MNLTDPEQTGHSPKRLFDRNLRGLSDLEQHVLQAADLLAHTPFPMEAIEAALRPSSPLQSLLALLGGASLEGELAEMFANDFQLANTRAKQADLQELHDKKLGEQSTSIAAKLTIPSLQRHINHLAEEMHCHLAHSTSADSR